MAQPKYAARNSYIKLHSKLLWRLLRAGKITPRKLWNAFRCWMAYHLHISRSAPSPLMVSIELWNECNINCMFCRNEKGQIFDINPEGKKDPIVKGRMSFEMYQDIIDQVKDRVLVAVLYTNGEPLMYKDLVKCIQYATQCNVATIIATNGTLMTEEKARELLEAGLDFIKIQLSGFTQDIYSVQVRNGDVEKIKNGIRAFSRINREGKYNALLLVDYISYNYNRHQFPLVQEFCDELGVMLSSRRGNPSHGLEGKEPALNTEPLPLPMSCDWLWMAMQINWNGEVLQCCESVIWSNPTVYKKFVPKETSLLDVWNAQPARDMRSTMTNKGRGAISICTQCTRKGISFKW